MVWPSVLSELWCVYSILPNNVMWFWFMPLFFLFCLLFFLSFLPFPHFSLPVISFFLSFPLRLSFPSFLSPPYFSLLYLISACFSLLYTHLFFSLFPCFVFKGLPDDFWWGGGVGKSWRVLQVSCQIFALMELWEVRAITILVLLAIHRDNPEILRAVQKLPHFSCPPFVLEKMKEFIRNVQGTFDLLFCVCVFL